MRKRAEKMSKAKDPGLCNACHLAKKAANVWRPAGLNSAPFGRSVRHQVPAGLNPRHYFTLARNGGHVEYAPFCKRLHIAYYLLVQQHLCFIWSRAIFYPNAPNMPHTQNCSRNIFTLFAIRFLKITKIFQFVQTKS